MMKLFASFHASSILIPSFRNRASHCTPYLARVCKACRVCINACYSNESGGGSDFRSHRDLVVRTVVHHIYRISRRKQEKPRSEEELPRKRATDLSCPWEYISVSDCMTRSLPSTHILVLVCPTVGSLALYFINPVSKGSCVAWGARRSVACGSWSIYTTVADPSRRPGEVSR
jgi:hypothetical protein